MNIIFSQNDYLTFLPKRTQLSVHSKEQVLIKQENMDKGHNKGAAVVVVMVIRVLKFSLIV